MDTEISREDLARVLYYTPRIHKLDLSASAVTHLLRGFDRISDQTYDQLLAAFNKFTSPHTHPSCRPSANLLFRFII